MLNNLACKQDPVTQLPGDPGLRPLVLVEDPEMDAPPSNHATAAAVLAYWQEAGPAKWFKKDLSFDDAFRSLFIGTHESAARGELEDWAATADGALALLLLLDQFPRNAFRGSARMFATDALALQLARRSISAGFNQQVDAGLRNFFYLPLMHSESLPDQQRAVALTEPLGAPFLEEGGFAG